MLIQCLVNSFKHHNSQQTPNYNKDITKEINYTKETKWQNMHMFFKTHFNLTPHSVNSINNKTKSFKTHSKYTQTPPANLPEKWTEPDLWHRKTLLRFQSRGWRFVCVSLQLFSMGGAQPVMGKKRENDKLNIVSWSAWDKLNQW